MGGCQSPEAREQCRLEQQEQLALDAERIAHEKEQRRRDAMPFMTLHLHISGDDDEQTEATVKGWMTVRDSVHENLDMEFLEWDRIGSVNMGGYAVPLTSTWEEQGIEAVPNLVKPLCHHERH